MTVLTASTSDQHQLVEIQKKSCFLNGIQPERHIALTIPHDYHRSKNPSWFRIRALLDHLHNHEIILWMDSDVMMLQPINWKVMLPGEHMLYVAKDVNGINHGVAAWRNTPKAREFLWRIYDSHWAFRNHPWHEQGVIHTLAERMDICYVDKQVFNAYESDLSDESCILHLPAKSFEHRLKVMGEQLHKLQNKS